jgi:DNA-binding FadR family transcriptional regulator
MTGRVYIDKVLQEVKSWIDRGDDFILEEDKDSAHGTGQNSEVRRCKEQIGLQYFFNASGSPDLSPIENIWRAQKQKIKAVDHFDDDTLVAAIIRCWDEIAQSTVNKYVDSMCRRMESLNRNGGEMTEF